MWTEEQTDELQRLLVQGLSASQIGERLGYSRNAVIGRIFRLGLAIARERTRRYVVNSPGRRKAPEVQAARVASLPTEQSAGGARAADSARPFHPIRSDRLTSLLALTNHNCRYPIGDPLGGSFRYCLEWCEGVDLGKPYCEEHASIAYARRSS